jgi:DeoR/GlpR family transcriptional regulator of sugar metabolism
MQRSERQRLIIRSVDSGARTVNDLVTLTGASAVSIRRDLVELSEQGALRRIRGGAAPLPSRGAEYPFEIRRNADAAEKLMLARTAAGLISPGDCVLIDNGTTALAVAEELSGLGITAMALSLHAAAALVRTPGNEVIVPGGVVGHGDLAFAGPGAAEAVRAMRFDVAILGACAADPENGLTVAGWGDAQVKRAAIECARRVVLVATPDKFERTAAHRFGTLKDLDTIVTTGNVPAALVLDARDAGITVIVAPEERT